MKSAETAIPERGAWQGMLQILVFNWRLYVAGAVTLASVGVALTYARLNPLWKALGIGGVAAAAFWMLFSLIAAHWVYDRSRIYKWKWIAPLLAQSPRRWANIHAGLDESTPALMKLFPNSDGTVLDIFDPTEMTEVSIAEARLRTENALRPVHADFRALPCDAGSTDAIFLIFAAHEIRRAESRAQFFKELARILKPTGRIVLVEHLRDWRNFVAFGPGFLHFLSRKTWLQAAGEANLSLAKEFSITPFVRVFVFERRTLCN